MVDVKNKVGSAELKASGAGAVAVAGFAVIGAVVVAKKLIRLIKN
jgi:hypothetical protein